MTEPDIIRQAQLWATGATIHDVNRFIQLWRAPAYALANNPDHPRREYCEALMKAALGALFDFMRHGDYRKAKENNPLPAWTEE